MKWSPISKGNESCYYDHTRAETPFGIFELTWKGWKEDPNYGFDETPWGEVWYDSWNSVEEAQKAAEAEMLRRARLVTNDEDVIKKLSALVIRVANKECTCSMVQRLNGDGCEVCNPQMAIDLIMEAER